VGWILAYRAIVKIPVVVQISVLLEGGINADFTKALENVSKLTQWKGEKR